MSMYFWGSTINGELGCGGVEDEHISIPREMDWPLASHIEYASSGLVHSLILTKEGQIYSCGSNDLLQLGRKDDLEHPRKRPHLVEGLKSHVITKVCCGSSHSLAINEWGNLFTWGSNSFFQLGHNDLETCEPVPKLVKALGIKHIIQIACGEYHNLALTNEGVLYTFGLNNHGQCGVGNSSKKISKPTKVTSLTGIPLAFIACGSYHSFAVSKSGAVYGFGKNKNGQLGTGDVESRFYPTQLRTLRSIGVRYIAAGEDFSVFLTLDGKVFTCGAGKFTGQNSQNNELLPRTVVELMGSICTQISCGNRHTLTYMPSRGKIFAFGLNSGGQLGTKSNGNALVPQAVIGPWATQNGLNTIEKNEEQNIFVKRLYSGGERSFATTTDLKSNSYDCRLYESNTQIECISSDLAKQCAKIHNDEGVDLSLMSSVETLFKSLACINGSFLKDNDEHMCCSSKNPGLHISDAEIAFDCISKMENNTLKNIIWEGITTQLVPSLVPNPPDVEVLRVYLLLPLYHEFINSKNYQTLHSTFARAVLGLTKIPLNIVSQWWSDQSTNYFERFVENYKGVVIHIMNYNYTKFNTNVVRSPESPNELPIVTYEANLDIALKMLRLLFDINLNQRSKRISYETFYIPELSELVDLQKDYFRWSQCQNQSSEFFLCNHPFIFDVKAKKLLLQTDQAIQMHRAVMQAQHNLLFYNFFAHQPTNINEFVVFNVTRENIVQDTIREICMRNAQDLKKPLKVKFFGEEAEDAGGVQKEFFMLLIKQLLDQKYGMFKEFDDSRLIWFSEHSFEGEEMYQLIGTLCGLAIYNFVIINLPFPLALYKKLLKEKVDLNDLTELSPILGNSMKNILDYDGDDMEQVFDLTFEVSREVFGHIKTVPLKPNGDKIYVNQENKKEFVDLYIDYIFNTSVEKQFNGFYAGFMKVCGGPIMDLFRAHELMAVVIGNEDYDWELFENSANYKDGYTSVDPTIRLFWEVFHELSLEEKKNFLLFLTGSDRIPIDGMKAIRITIQPVKEDKCLPVAHTCFNLLDLPRYQTKEKLKYKLLQAIQYNQGFSLV